MLSTADQARIQAACAEATKKIEAGDYKFYTLKTPVLVRAVPIMLDDQIAGYMVFQPNGCAVVEAEVFEKEFEETRAFSA